MKYGTVQGLGRCVGTQESELSIPQSFTWMKRPETRQTQRFVQHNPLLELLEIEHDIQEHFDQGPIEDLEYPNRWPEQPELAGFRPFMEDTYRQCDWVYLTLVKALEVGFGVKDGSLVKRCISSVTDLCLTHYPPIQRGRNEIRPYKPYLATFGLRHPHTAVPRRCW